MAVAERGRGVMNTTHENKRSKLVAALTAIPSHMRQYLQKIKADGEEFRKRPDLLWYLLLQCAATHGNSRSWYGLCGDPVTLNSVSYSKLAPLDVDARIVLILAALRKAKVRMPTIKAPQLASNVARIAAMGGVEQATKLMLSMSTRDEKFRFMLQFDGIGEKYGRNVWMDIYDPTFRNTVAVDQRLKKVARELGFMGSSYQQTETFYCAIARDAGLEPWELDRLLYNFTDHFLNVVGYIEHHDKVTVMVSKAFPVATKEGNNMRSAEQDNKSITSLSANLPVFMPKFQLAFDKCDSEIRNIFLDLVNRFVTYPIMQKTVDKPDYRFTKKYVFCAIVLQRKCLLIELRVDNYHLFSNLFTLEVIKDASRPGKRWIFFRVNNENQIEEAYRLIDEVYKFSA
jgi:hypothetical protein